MHQVSETNFSSVSMMDDFGRVFFQNGKVYRAIKREKVPYCLQLLKSDLFTELLKEGFIPDTKISDLSVCNYGIVLEHERLLETLQHEWTFSMLKDAALTILEINKLCNKYGYELKDCHLFNILFKGVKPVWIDLGSISPKIPGSQEWKAYDQFLRAVIIPMSFLSFEKPFIGRKLLESIFFSLTTLPAQDVTESGLLSLLPILSAEKTNVLRFRNRKLLETKERLTFISSIVYWTTKSFQFLIKRNTVFFTYEDASNRVKALTELFPYNNIESYINSLKKPNTKTVWEGYHQSYYAVEGQPFYSERFKRILKIIKDRKDIESVLDLAGNEGLFSKLLFENIKNLKQIITADYDENAIDFAYNNFKKLNTYKLNTVLLNLMYTPNIEGTQKRLQCDLVLALAITHHLLLTANYSIEAIFEKIRSYSSKYVIIEFMPLGLWSKGQTESSLLPQWYNLNWFKQNFERYFHLLVHEKLEENRILFFGKIK